MIFYVLRVAEGVDNHLQFLLCLLCSSLALSSYLWLSSLARKVILQTSSFPGDDSLSPHDCRAAGLAAQTSCPDVWWLRVGYSYKWVMSELNALTIPRLFTR